MSPSAAPVPRKARACVLVQRRTAARSQSQSAPGRQKCSIVEFVGLKTALARLWRLRGRPPACRRVAGEPRVLPSIPRLAPIRASTPGLRARRGRVQLRDPIWPGQRGVNDQAALTAEAREVDLSPQA